MRCTASEIVTLSKGMPRIAIGGYSIVPLVLALMLAAAGAGVAGVVRPMPRSAACNFAMFMVWQTDLVDGKLKSLTGSDYARGIGQMGHSRDRCSEKNPSAGKSRVALGPRRPARPQILALALNRAKTTLLRIGAHQARQANGPVLRAEKKLRPGVNDDQCPGPSPLAMLLFGSKD